jgi:hypothetical protein
MRSVLAVIAGYLIFAFSAAMLFQLTAQRPHEAARAGFVAASVAYGVAFAALGGYVAARIGARRPRRHAALVSGVIAAGALASLATSAPGSAIWSQLGALLLMAPAAAAAGFFVDSRAPR